jgi:hypothetical protein
MKLRQRGDDGYEDARVGRIFNARKPNRYPAAILLADDEDDVVAGIALARDNGWPVSVRSGGHSWAAWSLRDGALLIDLGRLDQLKYDDATGVVVAGPAVRGGLDLAPFLAERGRAFPGGHCPGVGLGGYLLQGGQGWNGRLMGWACESVVAVDVVTASGLKVRADETENADLYWAARGAGAGFPGIVTRFHLQTYAAPKHMWQDTWTFRLDDGELLLAWLHDLLPRLDRRVEPVVAATRLPGIPLYEGRNHPGTALLLHTTLMADSPEPLRVFEHGPLAGRELGHACGPTTVELENLAQAEQNPDGYRYAVDCTWTDAPAPILTPRLLQLWRELDTIHSFSIWYGWEPPETRPDMAFSVEGKVYVATYAIYEDEADDEKYRSWVHRRTADIAGAGVYLGDTDFTRRQDRFLSDGAWQRLSAVRASWDPDGLLTSYLTSDVEGLNRHG